MKKKLFTGVFAGVLIVTCIGSAEANLIDSTYGAGAGSFELGNFVNNGSGNMELTPGDTTITGWTVGGPGNGVDWLISPIFGTNSGLHAIDLIRHTASSIFTQLPTTIGQTYELSFFTATVSTGNALGTVSAGSLVNQTFNAPITPAGGVTSQAFSPLNFIFIATESMTTVTFAATQNGYPDYYGPVIDSVNVAPVPVPATILLFSSGLASMAGFRIRRKKQ